jgi:hypothetical protein
MLTKLGDPFHFVKIDALRKKLLTAKHVDLGEPPPKQPKKVKRGARKKLLPPVKQPPYHK